MKMETTNNDKNIVREFEIKGGIKVTAEIADPSKPPVVSTDEDDDILKVGGRNWKKFAWNDLFDSKIVNKLFRKYEENELGICPFVPNPEDPSESIGMWISVTDEETNRSYGDVIVRESIGQLLVVMFVSIACAELTDKRGHHYNVSTLTGTKRLYQDFVERIKDEATEEVRNYMAFQGGLLEATVRCKAACPEKVFKYINQIID